MSMEYHIGQRLSYDGHLCSVRYIGEVRPTKGNWLGVEWDDSSRGKHAGTHNDVKYFECQSDSPTAATFIRPQRPSDKSINVLDAIHQKYSAETKGSASNAILISGKEVEEVGFEKIRRQMANLQELRIVVIDSLCIARGSSLGAVCPNIRELDLSRNLFEDVGVVMSIIGQLPSLKSLKLDGNRFTSVDTTGHDRTARPYASLTSLTLDDTLLTWEEIAAIASMFPALSSLSAGANQLQNLPACALPATLTEVRLERNRFQSLEDLGSLYKLRGLQRLILKNNSISSVATTAAPLSRSVTDVDLSYNAIGTWSMIDGIAAGFPSIDALRISHNPVYPAMSRDVEFLETLGRLRTLEWLNYSEVTPNDRQSAETYYLSIIARELSAVPEKEASTVISWHPRFAELCSIYGEPAIRRATSSSFHPDSLASGMIRCTLRLDDGVQLGVLETERIIERQIPRSFTVYNMLGVFGMEFGIEESGFLELVSEERLLFPETRILGTLLEGASATILARWDEARLARCGALHLLKVAVTT